MVNLGYKLSSEEFGPADLVRYAAAAEQAGFEFGLISDHFHPWTNRQGQSPFVWTVIGAIAQATTSLRLGTAVTCPTIRVHPAIVAQAAATAASLMGEQALAQAPPGIAALAAVRSAALPAPLRMVRRLLMLLVMSFLRDQYL